jgi:hypothetical protein
VNADARARMRPIKLVVWLGDMPEPVRLEPVNAFAVPEDGELHLHLEAEQVPMLKRVVNDADRWRSEQ